MKIGFDAFWIFVVVVRARSSSRCSERFGGHPVDRRAHVPLADLRAPLAAVVGVRDADGDNAHDEHADDHGRDGPEALFPGSAH